MKPISAALLLFVLTLILAACTPAGAPTPAPTLPPPSPVPSQTPLPPTATPAPEIPPPPSSFSPLEDRLISSIPIDYAGQIVFAQGFLWIRTGPGHVIQVDPATNEILADIETDTTTDEFDYCFGFDTDGSNVWSCSAAGDNDHPTIDVVRIDPQTASITATIPVDKIFDQVSLPFLDNRIWVLSRGGDQLVSIDVETNQPDPPIDLGKPYFMLTAMGDSLYAVSWSEGIVIKIDPDTGAITNQVELKGARTLAAGEDDLWVAQDAKLARLDPDTLSTQIVFTGLPALGLFGNVFAGPDAVWVITKEGYLYHIDPATNTYVEQFDLGTNHTGNGIVIDDTIWVSSGGQLWHISSQ